MANSGEKITRTILGAGSAAIGGLRAIFCFLVFVGFFVDQALVQAGMGSPLQGLWKLVDYGLGPFGQVALCVALAFVLFFATGFGRIGALNLGKNDLLSVGMSLGAFEIYLRFSFKASFFSFFGATATHLQFFSFITIAAGFSCAASYVFDEIFGRISHASTAPESSDPDRQAQVPPLNRTPQQAHEQSSARFYLVTALIPLIPGIMAALMTQPRTRARAHALAALDLGALSVAAIAAGFWLAALIGSPLPPVVAWGAFALMSLAEAQRAAAGFAPSKSTRVITLSIFFDD
jgi:hypothetical protein